MKPEERIVIAGSCRTPMGKMGENFKEVSAQDLLTACFKGTLRKEKFDKDKDNGR